MGKLFIFECQDIVDKTQDKMTDKLQELLSRISWHSCGESFGRKLGFKTSHILLCERGKKISLCTSDDFKNDIIIEIIGDIRTKGVYDGPFAEESCLIFHSDSVYFIRKLITGWGSRISYGQGNVVFAQSMKWVLDKAGINTSQYNFYRDAYLDEADGYQKLMKIVHTKAENFFSLNSAGKKPGRVHPGEHIAIGVVGGFLSGLSSVINAILGAEVLPVDILPATSVVTRITYGSTPHVSLSMKDGTQKEITIENLPDYVTGLGGDGLQNALKVEEAVVYYPCSFCQNGVDIIDTPGLDNNECMDSITLETISKLDAVVMVLEPDSPFTVSEADFLLDVLLQHIGMNKIVFATNKMDKYADQRPDTRKRIVEGIRRRIKKCISQFVKDCEECLDDDIQKRSLEEILTQINIIPVSHGRHLKAGKAQTRNFWQRVG